MIAAPVAAAAIAISAGASESCRASSVTVTTASSARLWPAIVRHGQSTPLDVPANTELQATHDCGDHYLVTYEDKRWIVEDADLK